MNMKRYVSIMVLMVSLFGLFPLWADGAVVDADPAADIDRFSERDAYIAFLEAFVNGDMPKARGAALVLKERFPSSVYVSRADKLLSLPSAGADKNAANSGIVTFYLGSLVTGWTAAGLLLPTLGIYTYDPVVTGSLTLGGTAFGLGSAWLMSMNRPISAAQDLWIETVEVLTVANFEILYLSFVKTPNTNLVCGGSLALMLSSRVATYFIVRDLDLSFDQAAFAVQSAAWAEFYSAMTLFGLIQCENRYVNGILSALAVDAGLVGGVFAWNALEWSALRSGLVSVGGLGGLLVGSSVCTIGSIFMLDDARAGSAVLTGCTLAGQVFAVLFTQGLPLSTDSAAKAHSGLSFNAFPVAGETGAGMRLALGLRL